jgi:hypothetical protein
MRVLRRIGVFRAGGPRRKHSTERRERPGCADSGAVASGAVDADRTPEPDLDAIAADLAGVEAALAQLEDGTYVSDEPPDPDPA